MRAITGITLLVVFLTVCLFFYPSMRAVLLGAENQHIEELSATVLAELNQIRTNMQKATLVIASWDEGRDYILHRDSHFTENNMEDHAMHKDNGYGFLLIKDLEGRDIFTMGYDAQADADMRLPLGFSSEISKVAARALSIYAEDPEIVVADAKYAGIMFHDGAVYVVCSIPVTDNLRIGEPVGTFTFATRFNKTFTDEFLGAHAMDLSIQPLDADGNMPAISQRDDTITIGKQIEGIMGNPIALLITHPRTIYDNGRNLILTMSAALMILLAVALLAMGYVFSKLIISPVHKLSEGVMKATVDDVPDELMQSANVTEIDTLSGAIRAMIARMQQQQRAAETDKMSIDTMVTILNSIDAYLYVSDLETEELLFINDKMREHFNLGSGIQGEICWKVLQSGMDHTCEFCPIYKLKVDPNTSVVWDELNTVTGRLYHNTDKLIPWTGGKMAHLQYSQDITDIRQAQDKVLRLSGMIESTPQTVTFMNEQGECIYCNPAAQRVTGYDEAEILGTAYMENHLFNDKDLLRLQNEVFPTVAAEGQCDFTMEMRLKDGSIRLMQFCAFLLSGEEGGMGSIALDITETHRMEQALIEAKEIAEETTRAKSDFLSRMSHEMRTPMNAIIGMTNIAKLSQSWERREYCLDKIEGASKHLLGVINDILDMSKIEANKFELSNTDFSLDRVIETVVNVINFRVDEKHQQLTLMVDDRVPPALFGDEQRLAQVMTNLLTNACKFTPDGGRLSVNVHLIDRVADRVTLQIDVADTGIGISDEQKARLFKSFEQADGSTSRKFGGTGLGLAISKRIVEMMGGKIWIESEIGKGSTFSFTAAFGISELEFGASDDELRRKNLRILAVDDSDDALEYIRHVMAQLGESCDVAHSGKEAIAMIKSSEQPYDAIFVDFQMPGMDGIELTSEIKKHDNEHSVVIMISVAEWSEISGSALEVGVSSFIPKPLFPSQVVRCLNSLFNAGLGTRDGIIPGTKDDPLRFEGLNVLLAEDVEINREILTTMLAYTKINFEEAVNGQIAVDMFAANPKHYDMVLMDIQMPTMDGLEATRSIRALPDPWAKRIPIVAMTANAFREDVENCMAAGMNAHVAKPLDMPQVMKELDKWLKRDSDKEIG